MIAIIAVGKCIFDIAVFIMTVSWFGSHILLKTKIFIIILIAIYGIAYALDKGITNLLIRVSSINKIYMK